MCQELEVGYFNGSANYEREDQTECIKCDF